MGAQGILYKKTYTKKDTGTYVLEIPVCIETCNILVEDYEPSKIDSER